MLIRTAFAAAVIAVMAAAAIAGQTFGEPIFSGAGNAARSWLRTTAPAAAPCRRKDCASRRSRRPAAVAPEAASPAATPSASQIERKLGAPASKVRRSAE